MVYAMNGPKLVYPKMVHVTCAAHGLHRVAEFIRAEFRNVNKLISHFKGCTTKVYSENCYFQLSISNTIHIF